MAESYRKHAASLPVAKTADAEGVIVDAVCAAVVAAALAGAIALVALSGRIIWGPVSPTVQPELDLPLKAPTPLPRNGR